MKSAKLNRQILFQHVQFYIDQNYESDDVSSIFAFLGGLSIDGVLSGRSFSPYKAPEAQGFSLGRKAPPSFFFEKF